MTWHCHTAVATGGREKEGAPPPALRLMLVLVPPSHQTERIILQGGQQCVDKDTKRGHLRQSTVLQLPMPKTLVGAPTHPPYTHGESMQEQTEGWGGAGNGGEEKEGEGGKGGWGQGWGRENGEIGREKGGNK